MPPTLLKVTILHGCSSRFLNCANDTKSCKASHLLVSGHTIRFRTIFVSNACIKRPCISFEKKDNENLEIFLREGRLHIVREEIIILNHFELNYYLEILPNFQKVWAKPAFSKSAIETLEEGVKYVQS